MVETIINYFDTIPSLHRAIILVGGITFFWMLEGSIPLFRFSYNKLKHAIPNFFFTFTTILINFSLAFLLLKSSDWVSNNNFGLVHLYNFPLWIKVILGSIVIGFCWRLFSPLRGTQCKTSLDDSFGSS